MDWFKRAVGIVLLVTGAASAATPESEEAHEKPPAASSEGSAGDRPGSASVAAGLKAYADPETGALLDAPPLDVPAADTAAQPPAPAEIHGFDQVWEEQLPDGTGLVRFEGAMEMSVIATVDASGKVTQTCVPASSRGGTAPTPPAQHPEHSHAGDERD